MKITIISLFPAMITGFMHESIIQRAQDKGIVVLEIINLRDFASDSYGTVDDKPYGGGAGMVLRADVVLRALATLQSPSAHHVLTTPKGMPFTQKIAEQYATVSHLIILAGHYEGYDERIRSSFDDEVSLGDFVLTGGELAAACITDAVVRLLPGTLEKPEASREESYFQIRIEDLERVVGSHPVLTALESKGLKSVRLLEYPQYTRPQSIEGKAVPDILLSGNHAEIAAWRLQKAFEETLHRRPDLLSSVNSG